MDTSDDPGTLAVAAIAGKTALDTVQTNQQYKQQEALAKYNQQVYSQDAAAKRAAGASAANMQREQTRRLLSGRKAGWAKSGFVGSEGSPAMDLIGIASAGELDAKMTSYNYNVAAQQSESAAYLEGYKAKAYHKARPLAIGASLLGGASDYAFFKAATKAA